MPPFEQSSIDFFFDEFKSLLLQAIAFEPGVEREAWMVWGYEKSLLREEAQFWLASQSYASMVELASIAESMEMELPVPNLTQSCQRYLFLGVGYFYGLRQSLQITGFAWQELRERLHRWLREEQEFASILETLLDVAVPHHYKLVLRQRAYLVQRLREIKFSGWMEVRELLFWPDSSVAEELMSWKGKIRSALSPRDLRDIRDIGKGALLSPAISREIVSKSVLYS